MSRWPVSRYAAVGAPVMWGSTYVVTTELLPPDRPMFAAVARALPAGLLLLVGRSLPRREWVLRTLVIGTLNIGLFFALLFVAAYRLPGGIAAMMGSVQPLFVIFLAATLLGTAIRPVHIITSLLGTAGVVMLVSRSTMHLDAVGMVAAVGATISMAAGMVLTKKWGRPVPLLVFTGWQLLAGGLVLLVPMLLFEGVPTTFTYLNVIGYLYLCLVGSCIAYTIWFRGVEQLSAPAVSFLGLVTPVVATVLGYVFLGQGLAAWQYVGMVVVLLAVLAGQMPGSRAQLGRTDPTVPSGAGGGAVVPIHSEPGPTVLRPHRRRA